jgi:hypothetical protein
VPGGPLPDDNARRALYAPYPVNGYYAHGLYVFNPFALIGELELNGFRVLYQEYSREEGKPISDPAGGGHILIWLVAV